VKHKVILLSSKNIQYYLFLTISIET